MVGIPTVLITVSKEESAQMRPPRAIEPEGFKIGNPFGRPGQVEVQRAVLARALNYFNELVMPGQISTINFPGY